MVYYSPLRMVHYRLFGVHNSEGNPVGLTTDYKRLTFLPLVLFFFGGEKKVALFLLLCFINPSLARTSKEVTACRSHKIPACRVFILTVSIRGSACPERKDQITVNQACLGNCFNGDSGGELLKD